MSWVVLDECRIVSEHRNPHDAACEIVRSAKVGAYHIAHLTPGLRCRRLTAAAEREELEIAIYAVVQPDLGLGAGNSIPGSLLLNHRDGAEPGAEQEAA